MLKVEGSNPGLAVYFRDFDRVKKQEFSEQERINSRRSFRQLIHATSIFENKSEVDILGGFRHAYTNMHV